MDSALPNGQIHFELCQYCLRDSHGGNHGDSRHGDSRDGRGSLHGDRHGIRGVRSVSLGSEINSVLKYLWANWYWLDVVQLVAFAYLCKLLMMPTHTTILGISSAVCAICYPLKCIFSTIRFFLYGIYHGLI